MNTNLTEDLEALKKASGIITDRVFEAHQSLEGDSFLQYRDRAIDLIAFIKDEVAQLEEELERVRGLLVEEEEDSEEEPIGLLSVPEPKLESKQPDPKPVKVSDSQKKLDDLMNQVTNKRAGVSKSYPKSEHRGPLSDELKSHLRNMVKNGVKHVNPDVLDQMSTQYSTPKIRIAEYVGWLQR